MRGVGLRCYIKRTLGKVMARNIRLRVCFELLVNRIVVLSLVVLRLRRMVLQRTVAFYVAVRVYTFIIMFEFISVILDFVIVIYLLRWLWCHSGHKWIGLLTVEGQITYDDVAISINQFIKVMSKIDSSVLA